MSLYVRDKEVARLAKEVQEAIGAPTKTEAVRVALQRLLRDHRKSAPLLDRLKRHQQLTLSLGKPRPDFDEKAFTDDLWGNE